MHLPDLSSGARRTWDTGHTRDAVDTRTACSTSAAAWSWSPAAAAGWDGGWGSGGPAGGRGLGGERAFGAARCGADVVIASRTYEACLTTAGEIEKETGRAALPYAGPPG